MLYENLSDTILDAVFYVHRKLGPGLLEHPYHMAMYYQLKKQGLKVGYEVPYIIDFDGNTVGEYYADLVVENKIILEIKSVQTLHKAMTAQVLNYLKISRIGLGYLVNFHSSSVVWKRIVNFSP